MIEAVQINGFQSHVESRFNLGSGLNVITGPSDAGKTAILRAIRWVAFNEPQGEAYVNEAVGLAEVKILLTSGAIITKRRRKGKTMYAIQENEAVEGSVFEKSEVPDEVKGLLGLETTSFGDFKSALNFSFQLDAPFLISETASAGAKVLGKLAGTESVDLAIKGVSKDTYAARQRKQEAEKDIERITASLFEYQDIDNQKEAIDVAEQLIEKIDQDYVRSKNLKDYWHQYEVRSDRIEDFSKQLQDLAIVDDLTGSITAIEKAQTEYENLLDLNDQYFGTGNKLTEVNREIEKYKEITEAAEIVEVITNASQQLAVISSLTEEYQKYTAVVNTAEETIEKTKDVEKASINLGNIENSTLVKVNDLRVLKVEYYTAEKRHREAQERLSDFLGVTEGQSILDSTANAYETISAMYDLREELNAASNRYSSAADNVSSCEDHLKQAQEELNAAWEEAGGICPICEQPVERGHSHA